MKIGTRLTLWGTVITLAACAAVCVTLYLGLSVSLNAEVDSFLEGEVQEFLAILRDEQGASFDEIESDIRRELGSRVRNDLTFRLLDSRGRLILTSHEDTALPDPWPLTAAAFGDRDTAFETVHTHNDDRTTRVCSLRTQLVSRGDFVVQATYSLAGVNAALSNFRNLSLIVLALAAVGSVGGGRILARKSLRPIHAMTSAARKIGANDLSQRLDRSGDGDELDQLADVLNDMLHRLEQQVLRIRQFTADAAHELRTPLAALRGNAEVALSDQATPESRKQALEESIEEYDRLAKLTDDLLLLARADAGHALIQSSPVALHKAVEDVVELFGAVADEQGIVITCEHDRSVVIPADPARIRQVLCNVFDNAVKFTPPGGRIDIRLVADDSNAVITITDSGIGVDSANLPHLFDRFYRANTARSRDAGGFGLGLPICRTIVEAHGGEILITSNHGQGTCVEIRFPTAQTL